MDTFNNNMNIDSNQFDIFDKMINYYSNEKNNYIEKYYNNDKLSDNELQKIDKIIKIIDNLKINPEKEEYELFFNTIFGLIYKLKNDIADFENKLEINSQTIKKISDLNIEKDNTIKIILSLLKKIKN